MTPADAPSVITQVSLTRQQSSLRMACKLQSVSQSVSQSENLPSLTSILLIDELISRGSSVNYHLSSRNVPKGFHLHKQINPHNYLDLAVIFLPPSLMSVLMNITNAALFEVEKGGDRQARRYIFIVKVLWLHFIIK